MPSAELLSDPAGRRLEAATAVARALGGETELDRTLALIADRGRTLIDADGLLILLREDGGLVVAAGAGDVPDDVCGSRVAGSPDRIRDALGLASGGGMLVPLIFRGQSVGMLVAFGTRGDLSLLQAFAASAATAVATARRVEEQRLRDALHAADEERSRWARELHDDTLQGLGGLRMLLTAAARSSDPAQLRSAVEGAVERIEEEIDGLRGLIRELRPAALDQLGLAAAIEGLATRTAERQGIVVEVTVELRAARYAPALETALYRIVQEAVGNAVRHSGASSVEIAVGERGGVLHVRVHDDGRGFDPSADDGFGLTGMRERVALRHGELEITSSPGGTTVCVALPVTA